MTYPGSSMPLRTPAQTVAERQTAEAAEQPPAWDANPILMPFKGEQREFFTIGMLGVALGRSANTLREWEALEYLPPARWRTPNRTDDPQQRAVKHGQRRMYSREQVEGLREIARQEGLLDGSKPIGSSNFPARAKDLFVKLRSQQ